MKTLLILISLICALTAPTDACFGPKLYLGVPSGPAGELQHALISIYLKEKTGTEVDAVIIDQDPRVLIGNEQIDFAFVTPRENETALLVLSADAVLLAGKRILATLQFTTTIPALAKLGQQLQPQHYAQLLEQVRQGAAPLALVRQFYFDQRWI
ncbi:MAG: hypothetical protein RQ724_08800 [Desulfuromonadales bacterium]|nr:hypothetical protein [Desulfuromonadales bacterium]